MKTKGYFCVSEFEYRKEILDLKRELQKEIAEKNSFAEEKRKSDELVQSLLNSKSWKITRPLRKITNLLKKEEESVEEASPLDNSYTKYDSYVSEYEDNIDFTGFDTTIKPLAFYLPQYHTFKENDEWWGKGFTEWTNVKKANPLFEGHYQPRTPHKDIGYYKLDNIETIKKQIELAKEHGIYGFCYYYYWFSSKRLLEKPLDLLLEHKEIDFPFLLCWANENWSRTWDGLDTAILMKQEYSENDYTDFIKDIKKYTDDKRYIRIDGKPVIMIYNPYQIPNFKKLCTEWRKEAKKQGIGEIVIWCKNDLADTKFERAEIVDAEFDFAPHGFFVPNEFITGLSSPKIINYEKLVSILPPLYKNHYPLKPFYYSATMGWDNSARKKEGYMMYHNYHLESFYKWVRLIVRKTEKTHPEDKRFIFINAWNEWGEGTYLEPDAKYGYANINTLSKAIYHLPFHEEFKMLESKTPLKKMKKIAVQLHLYHEELKEEYREYLSHIPYSFDLYISVREKVDTRLIYDFFEELEHANKVVVESFPNHGRDILPMILQMKDRISEYTYFLHIHTKKSTATSYGDGWRTHLLSSLLPSKEETASILNTFEKDPNLGLLYPVMYSKILDQTEDCLTGALGGNKEKLLSFCKKFQVDKNKITENILYPSGFMFWARVDKIEKLFTYKANDFEEEDGQLDRTTAHGIERGIGLLVEKNKGHICAYQIKKGD